MDKLNNTYEFIEKLEKLTNLKNIIIWRDYWDVSHMGPLEDVDMPYANDNPINEKYSLNVFDSYLGILDFGYVFLSTYTPIDTGNIKESMYKLYVCPINSNKISAIELNDSHMAKIKDLLVTIKRYDDKEAREAPEAFIKHVLDLKT